MCVLLTSAFHVCFTDVWFSWCLLFTSVSWNSAFTSVSLTSAFHICFTDVCFLRLLLLHFLTELPELYLLETDLLVISSSFFAELRSTNYIKHQIICHQTTAISIMAADSSSGLFISPVSYRDILYFYADLGVWGGHLGSSSQTWNLACVEHFSVLTMNFTNIHQSFLTVQLFFIRTPVFFTLFPLHRSWVL